MPQPTFRYPLWRTAAVVVSLATCSASGPARSQITALTPAETKGWQEYAYPDAGFAAQFPAQPILSEGSYRAAGVSAPSRTYAARKGGIDFSVTVADFNGTSVEQKAAIDDVVKAFAQAGEIKLDVTERIDRQFGRELRVSAKDGSILATAIFFYDHRLYVLAGKALPPNPDPTSAETVRFQQSLEFIDKDGRRPRRPEDGGGAGFARDFGLGPGPRGEGRGEGGGEGRGRRRPPPEAFADCKGKASGDSVQHQIPNGEKVAATCVQTPEGLAARPIRGPRGDGRGPPDGPPEGPPG